ncbi:MAG: hypothetical protein WCA98_14575, partial [Candidatus Acidiferrales bacterium]
GCDGGDELFLGFESGGETRAVGAGFKPGEKRQSEKRTGGKREKEMAKSHRGPETGLHAIKTAGAAEMELSDCAATG